MIVADKAGRLKIVNQVILAAEVPYARLLLTWTVVLVPYAVKPYRSYRAVAGQKFGELRVYEIHVMLPCIYSAAGAVMSLSAVRNVCMPHACLFVKNVKCCPCIVIEDAGRNGPVRISLRSACAKPGASERPIVRAPPIEVRIIEIEREPFFGACL